LVFHRTQESGSVLPLRNRKAKGTLKEA